MSPAALRHRIGQLLIAGFDGQQIPVELKALAREFGLGGVILFARNIARAGAGRRPVLRGRAADAGAAGLGQRRPGGRAGRAPEGAVHRVAADGDARTQRRRRAGRAVRPRAGGRDARRSASRSTTRRCSTSTPTRRIRSSAIARWPRGRRRWRGWARRSSAACRAKGSPRAASIFPGTATPAPIRTSSCRWSSIRIDRLRGVEFVPFRAAIEAQVATIMTAHVLMPALDETRPATLSKRIVTGLLRERAAATTA